MTELSLLFWAAVPPLVLLVYYYYRVYAAPSLLKLLWLFVLGAISGFAALNLELILATVTNLIVDWQRWQRSLLGVALRQLVEIGPIEEGCKLIMVVIATCYFQRRYRLRPTTVFLFTIAVALGFTAQENWIYLSYNTSSILERIIGTPVHAMFSAPWGYALGIYLCSRPQLNQYRQLVVIAWLNSVVCHALVNVLSIAWRYPLPLSFLSYGLFPFLLWLFWRLEQLLRRVQGKSPINLISGFTKQHRYWRRGLVLLALMLGGNALFGLLLLARKLSPLRWAQLFYPDILQFTLKHILLNLIFAVVAWLIYFYLRRSAQRQFFKIKKAKS
ncbi:PrsW family glutamic-type intramembrane protease [Fortiea contorta]|uniref:PrsW family glutamic-type intramembrane protease n=1 Tax=Fortiea contorta TaxID=1892405 RepID=UPI000349E29F|nr:PrsW family glutamic-type intramembrane protease [Fortiea contorta]